MKPARFLPLGVLIFIFAFSTFSYGAVPQMINYQGKITTPVGALIDSNLSMVFSIYENEPDVSPAWAETLVVQVEKGIFSVLLGNVYPIPPALFDGTVQYLGVKAGTDPEMTPRKEIVSVAYAYRSAMADSVTGGGGSVNCADCDDRFVNVQGPDSLVANADTGFVVRTASTAGLPGVIGVFGSADNTSLDAYRRATGGYFTTDSSGNCTVWVDVSSIATSLAPRRWAKST